MRVPALRLLGLWSLGALLALLAAPVVRSAPLAIHVTGQLSNEEWTINYTDGTHDTIRLSASVDLTVEPAAPSCRDGGFISSSARLTGDKY